MKCNKCNSDVLESFRFCHKCGEKLVVECSSRSGSNIDHSTVTECSEGGVSGPSLSLLTPSSRLQKGTVRTQRIESFNEFRKRKSEERMQHETSKKGKTKPSKDKEVSVGIGILTLAKGEMKPIRGKVKMLRVHTTIRKLDLLKQAYEKHCAHDRTFDRHADYTLAYPDGTEVLTLPDHPNRIFQLDDYQKELGKAYNRITLYLLKRSDQENYNNLQESASDSGSDTDEGSVRQMTITESFAKVTNLTNDTMVQDTISIDDTVMQATVDQRTLANISKGNDNLPGTSFSTQEKVSAHETTTGIKTIREMFPNHDENELKQALELTESLEDAINVVLDENSMSLNNMYGSLIREECNADFNALHDEDENLEFCQETSSSTLYTVNTSLTKKLQNYKEQFIDSSKNFRVKVRRQHVWEDTLVKLQREEGALMNQIKVQFIGEPAVDQGGPSREYFGLINEAAQRKLMAQSVFRHNISAFTRREYYAFGQLTAIGLLQGSPGPRCFIKSVFDYICSGNIENLTPSLDEIPFYEIKTNLMELESITDPDVFKQKASFESDYRFDAGYTKPIVTIADKEDFIRCHSLHYTILVSLSELNQYIDGLKTCNILDLIKAEPESFRCLFEVHHSKLSAEDVDSIFDPVYSPAGSNKFAIEQSIIFNFNQYLEDVENGKVVGQLEDREVKISLNDILQFATGAQNVPAVGFSPHPTIVFQHDLVISRKISTNTCANILKFPVSGLEDRKRFSEEFTFCLLNSPGFQLV